MLIVDAHLDLAYNALRIGRDLLRPVEELRQLEASRGPGHVEHTGTALVTLPALREAGLVVVFGTIFAAPATSPLFNAGERLVYTTVEEAHRVGQEQLDYYHRLADDVDYIRLIGDHDSLEEVVASHTFGQDTLVGILPLMEGADPIREPAEAEMWYERGLRVVGLAWDDTRYAGGAWHDVEGLTSEGRRLLSTMAELGLILDLTHMSEAATLQALDSFEGQIIASHSNARALVPTKRQLSDIQIRRLTERDGVIGIVLANSFLKSGHRRGEPKQAVTLDHVAAHIDHICQLAGDATHVGIGSDFDGGFGLEDTPAQLNHVADLPLIGKALKERGYSEDHIAGIMGANWLRLLRASFSD